jgi:(2Fe-2S) ferredoxin
VTGSAGRVRVRVCRDCCCGTALKHPEVDHDALFERLVAAVAGAADVDASACLLACEKSNVVVVQPGRGDRRAGVRPVWLREVLDERAVDAIASWVHAGGPGLSDPPAELLPLLTTPGVLGEAVL